MKLLIPGPVATSPEVRAALAQEIAPWDPGFRPLYAGIRDRVAALGHCDPAAHAVLPLQGCGHFAIEAAVRGLLPVGGKLLVPLTGSYADRMARLAREAGRIVVGLPWSATAPLDPAAVAAALAADGAISHVGLVYSETSSGVIHDPAAIGAVVRAAGRRMLVDAVSAFGALPLDMAAQPEIDAAVFTANKCLEGVPGVSFLLTRVAALAEGRAGSWSFDLLDIYRNGMANNWSSCRFTPAAQVMAALRTALRLHEIEGQPARLARYRANADTLYDGMSRIGLHPVLPRAAQGPVVLNVHAPADPAWSLQGFVDALKARGFTISNFYNTARPSFRVGCIGAITPDDMRRFLRATDSALRAMGVRERGGSETAA